LKLNLKKGQIINFFFVKLENIAEIFLANYKSFPSLLSLDSENKILIKIFRLNIFLKT